VRQVAPTPSAIGSIVNPARGARGRVFRCALPRRAARTDSRRAARERSAGRYPPGKGWHKLALEDGRATLRIRGERYPVTLSKVDDPALQDAVLAVLARKYPNHPSGEYWVFAVTSRSE
jgi:hypothetical protein